MAKQKSTFGKRSREDAKRQKRKEKSERRAMKKLKKEKVLSEECHEDPDLAGIVPGPQNSTDCTP